MLTAFFFQDVSENHKKKGTHMVWFFSIHLIIDKIMETVSLPKIPSYLKHQQNLKDAFMI